MSFVLRTTEDGLTLGSFPHLGAAHAVAGRTGGVSAGRFASLNLGPRSGDLPASVNENRRRFLAGLGVGTSRVIAPRQVHSAEVSVHRRGDPVASPGVYGGDGLVTDDPEVIVMVLAADCAALLLHDPVTGVVAALHAGWRGTAGGIATNGVRRMMDDFGCRPADIRAGLGPAIGRCCYEVGIDVAEQVAVTTPRGSAVFERRGPGKAHLDIVAANVAHLLAAGLSVENIAASGVCTACRTDLFYSHRRESEPTGRFGAAITLGPTRRSSDRPAGGRGASRSSAD
jgi:YfiH family protein